MTRKEQYIAFIKHKGNCSMISEKYTLHRFCDICVIRGAICKSTYSYIKIGNVNIERYNKVVALALKEYGEEFLFEILL